LGRLNFSGLPGPSQIILERARVAAHPRRPGRDLDHARLPVRMDPAEFGAARSGARPLQSWTPRQARVGPSVRAAPTDPPFARFCQRSVELLSRDRVGASAPWSLSTAPARRSLAFPRCPAGSRSRPRRPHGRPARSSPCRSRGSPHGGSRGSRRARRSSPRGR